MLNNIEIGGSPLESVPTKGVEVKRLGEERKPPAEGVRILDFEEENKERIKPGKYALIAELTLSHWDEDSALRKQIGTEVAEELGKLDEFKNKAIALTPKYMFLPELDRGPWLAVRIEIAEVEDMARMEAEEWFWGLLAEVRDFEREGKAKRIIRRHLLGDYYIGDIWNLVSGAYAFLQVSPAIKGKFLEVKGETRKDFLERKRLAFIYRLETANREEIAPYIPKKAGERLSQLTDYVRENEWNELKDIERLIEKKEGITNFVSRFF